tara:strand:- start:43 stop:603 length:561 start_codon:yes stop_codon:yes gene_type:complete
MAKSLGGGMYSEDIVSESYLKLDKYKCENKIIRKGKVSKGYMFFVIRSIFINYIKQSNKIKKVDISTLYDLTDKSWFCDVSNNSHSFRNIKENQDKVHYHSEDIIKEYAYGKICDKIDKEIESWHWYDKKIFEVYRDTPLTIRGMAKETKISTVNIFHTLKKSKNIIREKFAEDYEDFKNGDYDLI